MTPARWRVLHVVLPLLCVAGCRVDRVAIAVDVSAVDALAPSALRAVAYADDGNGCDGQRFVAAPTLTALDAIERDADEIGGLALALPRLGDKLIVVDALGALEGGGASLGRGCAELGVIDGAVDLDVIVLPTTSAVSVAAGTVVVGSDDDSAIDVAVTSSAGGSAGVAVQARVTAAFGDVGDDAIIVADDDGFARLRPTLPPLGPVRATFISERPAIDAPVTVSVFVAPVPSLRFQGAPLQAPVVVPLEGDVVVVSVDGDAGSQGLSTRRFADDGATPRQILPPAQSVRFLGAFGDAGADAEDSAFALAVVDDELVALDLDVEAADTVIARRPLPVGIAGLVAIAAGDCRRGPLSSPVLLTAGDDAVFVDVAFGAIVVVPLSEAQRANLSNPLLSGCVSDDDAQEAGGDSLARVFFGPAATAPAQVRSGDRGGVASIGVARDAVLSSLSLPAQVIQVSVRDDGAAILARVDAGQVLVAPHRIQGGVFTDVSDGAFDPARLLPSAPLFLAQGHIFTDLDDGVALDTVAILDLGTEADPNATAVFGVAGADLQSGVDGLCTPASACGGSIAKDLDGDGRLEIITFVEGSDGVAISILSFGRTER